MADPLDPPSFGSGFDQIDPLGSPDDTIPGKGDLITIQPSGFQVRGVWTPASPSAAARYIDEEQWRSLVFFVQLPEAISDQPYSLTCGMELLWNLTGYTGVVRALIPHSDNNDRLILFTAIVVIESGQ